MERREKSYLLEFILAVISYIVLNHETTKNFLIKKLLPLFDLEHKKSFLTYELKRVTVWAEESFSPE